MNIYPYGSRVYGTQNNLNSDYDFVIVSENETLYDQFRSLQFNYSDAVDFNIYTKLEWQKKLDDHDIDAIECYSLPVPIMTTINFNFQLNLQQLRKSISAKASHSWVKAKKKLEVEGDIRSGIKSLFHSLRILIFGIQIAKFGKITDFTAANHLWYTIDSEPKDWKWLKDKYQPVFNELSTEFKKLAPKV